PLPGVTVSVGAVQAVTKSDGSFLLDFGASPPTLDRMAVSGIQLGGATYPPVAELISLELGHALYTGVNNVIARPIFLPALDMAGAVMVDPAKDTTVAPTALAGASLFIKAGTLMEPGGQPFTGMASITAVPVVQTPAALPANLKPSL